MRNLPFLLLLGCNPNSNDILQGPSLELLIFPPDQSCPGATIAFEASVAHATATCTLDGAPAAPCTSPFALPAALVAGDHELTVTATLDGASVARTLELTIDPRPDVQIAGLLPVPDAANETDPTGTIAWASTKPGTARCGIDGQPPVDCSDGFFAFADLSDQRNPHHFKVEVKDACGQTDAAVLDFDVDSTPPAPVLVAPSATSLAFDAEPGSYRCAIDAGAPFDCVPRAPIAIEGLAAGGHRLDVDGTDRHGNSSSTALDFLK